MWKSIFLAESNWKTASTCQTLYWSVSEANTTTACLNHNKQTPSYGWQHKSDEPHPKRVVVVYWRTNDVDLNVFDQIVLFQLLKDAKSTIARIDPVAVVVQEDVDWRQVFDAYLTLRDLAERVGHSLPSVAEQLRDLALREPDFTRAHEGRLLRIFVRIGRGVEERHGRQARQRQDDRNWTAIDGDLARRQADIRTTQLQLYRWKWCDFDAIVCRGRKNTETASNADRSSSSLTKLSINAAGLIGNDRRWRRGTVTSYTTMAAAAVCIPPGKKGNIVKYRFRLGGNRLSRRPDREKI